MAKQQANKNMNFRQTHSERSATASYKAFGNYQKGIGIGKSVKGLRTRNFGSGK